MINSINVSSSFFGIAFHSFRIPLILHLQFEHANFVEGELGSACTTAIILTSFPCTFGFSVVAECFSWFFILFHVSLG